MRTSYLSSQLKQAGAQVTQRFGIEYVKTVSTLETEYQAVRNAVGLTDFSHLQLFRLPEESAVDFLDELIPGGISQLRFGRVLHTFLPDEEGNILADLFVANNDDEYLLIFESLLSDEALTALLENAGGTEAGLTALNATHTILGVDGFQSWKVMKTLFGMDVLGLLYLSIERYEYEGTECMLLRSGKTGEFGYLLIAPHEVAASLFSTLLNETTALGGALCGSDAHDALRLDGRFFNIYKEGYAVKDPLILGLQWMIDFEKEHFRGSEKLLTRRQKGLTSKVIGIQSGAELAEGDALFIDGEKHGVVVNSTFSCTLGAWVALAQFPYSIAYAGISGTVGSATGDSFTTISMPPFMPKSLTVKLDEI